MSDQITQPQATPEQRMLLREMDRILRADPDGISVLYRYIRRQAVEFGAIDQEGNILVDTEGTALSRRWPGRWGVVGVRRKERGMKRPRSSFVGRRVKAISTTRYTCHGCKRGFSVPLNEGGDGIGECEHCGCTSYTISDGRPWGPRHRFWNDWVRSQYRLDEEDRVTRETMFCFSGMEHELPKHLILEAPNA